MLLDTDLRFGRCQVQWASRTVWLDGTPQALPAAAFDFLALLLQRRPQVVTTGELARTVWRGAPVSESLLARTVMQVRAAIGDTRPQVPWLQDVHGLGYRLALPEPATDDHRPAPAPAHGTPPRALRLGLLPCVAVGPAPLPPGMALGLPALLAEAMADLPGLAVVPAADLQALQPAPSQRSLPLASLALQACALDHVLHLGWRTDGPTPVLGWQLRSARSPGPGGECRGDEGFALAPAVADAVWQALQAAGGSAPRPPARPQALSADPFILQAFARGVTLHHQGRWQAAGLAFDLVRQACPDSLSPRLWQLRGNVALALPAAPEQARALADTARSRHQPRIGAEALALGQQALARAPSAAEREGGSAQAAEALGLLDNRRAEPWALSLRVEAALCAATCGHWAQARIWLEQAVGDARAAGLPLWLGRALLGLARIELSLGDAAAARGHLDEAMRAQRSGCDAATRARTLALQALTQRDQGRLGTAVALADEALALVERQPDSQRPAEALSTLALVQAEQAHADGVARILAALGPPVLDAPATRTHRLVVQACAALCRGDAAAARQGLAVALACRGDAASQGVVGSWLSLLSRLDSVEGRHDEALALLPGHEGGLGLPAGPTARALQLHAQAAAACSQGRPEAAHEALEQLIALNLDGRLQACARLDAAWLLLQQGRAEAASGHLLAAGAWPTEHPAGLAAQARLHHAQGQRSMAVHLQRLALRQFRGAPPSAHQALLQAYLSDGEGLPVLPVLLTDSWLPAPPATTNR